MLPEPMIPPLFCTLAWQRSGTKFLGSCLAKGIEVKPFGEIFHPSSTAFINYFNWLKSRSLPLHADSRSEPLYDDFFQHMLAQFGISHFDVMLNQLHGLTPAWSDTVEPFFLEFAKARGYWLILLTRSTTELFRSNEILKRSGVAHVSGASSEVTDIEAFDVSREEFFAFEKKIAHHYKTVRTSMINYPRFIEISFEELTGSQGFLPPKLIAFFEKAIRGFRSEDYEPLVQLRPSGQGRAPTVPEATITNFADLTTGKSAAAAKEGGTQ